jgi:AsmA protein
VRALKILALISGGLVALIAIALIAVWLLVDPNDYKERIAREVRSATGRELALPGKIKLAVFPWIALELGPASLGNPPGFGSEPFATVQRAAVRVRLLPLLRKRLEIGRVEVDGLDLRLVRGPDGRGNWQDFGTRKPTAARSAPQPFAGLPDLAGITIEHSRISYQGMVADHVALDVGHLTTAAPVAVTLKLDLTTRAGARPIPIVSKLNATMDPAKQRYGLTGVELEGTWSPASAAKAVPWKFSAASLDLDLAAQSLTVSSFMAQLAAARLSGSAQVSKLIDAPAATLLVKLDPMAPRDLMRTLAVPLPETRDPNVLQTFALTGELAYGGNALRVTQIDATLDDTRLHGSVALTDLDAKAIEFDLAVDRIDADRYRSPEEKAPRPASAKPAADANTELLKSLHMKGELMAGSVRFAGVNLTRAHVGVLAQNGVAHLAPLKAGLYGGEYSGDITLDARGSAPMLKLDQSMTGIDIAQLLSDFAHTRRLSGRGTVTTALTARGNGNDALVRSLSGHVSADLAGGALEGLDLWFEISRVTALIQKQAMPAGGGNGRTRFDVFKASADLTNGVAATKDLNIASQNLRVTGQGTSNLVSGAIDYRVKATILKSVPTRTAAPGVSLVDIPINVTGTLSTPRVQPDLEGIAKARIQQEIDKHKGNVQQKLQDVLKQFLK